MGNTGLLMGNPGAQHFACDFAFGGLELKHQRRHLEGRFAVIELRERLAGLHGLSRRNRNGGDSPRDRRGNGHHVGVHAGIGCIDRTSPVEEP